MHGVEAMPGKGTYVPLVILGSSLFGAQLAAQLGLPYSFASHFAPQALEAAVATYRREYQPSEQFPQPYVIAAVNVTAADTSEAAAAQAEIIKRNRVRAFAGRGRTRDFTEDELDMIVHSPQGQQIIDMLRYWACGTGDEVRAYLESFRATAQADELMISLQAPSTEETLTGLEILARAWGITPQS